MRSTTDRNAFPFCATCAAEREQCRRGDIRAFLSIATCNVYKQPLWPSMAAFTASPIPTSARCFRAEFNNVHLAFRRQIEKLLSLQVRNVFALGVELLGELYALFLHDLMRLVRTADEVKILASRNANLLVFSIQTDTEHFWQKSF
jgi:hypothetical protein